MIHELQEGGGNEQTGVSQRDSNDGGNDDDAGDGRRGGSSSTRRATAGSDAGVGDGAGALETKRVKSKQAKKGIEKGGKHKKHGFNQHRKKHN